MAKNFKIADIEAESRYTVSLIDNWDGTSSTREMTGAELVSFTNATAHLYDIHATEINETAAMTELETLAILENLRIRHPESDHILRVASACVAVCFGFPVRADWTGELSRLGLVSYGCTPDLGAAELNYKRLMEKADSILAEKRKNT